MHESPPPQNAVCEEMSCFSDLFCINKDRVVMISVAIAIALLILVVVVSLITAYCTSRKSCLGLCGCCGAGQENSRNAAEARTTTIGVGNLEEVVTGGLNGETNRSAMSGDTSGSFQPKYLKVGTSSEKKRKWDSISSTSDVSELEKEQYVRQSPDLSDRSGQDGATPVPGENLINFSALDPTPGNVTEGDLSIADVTESAGDTTASADTTANDSARLIQP